MMRRSQTHNRQGLGRALTGGMPPHCEDVSVVRGLLYTITQGRQPEADYSRVGRSPASSCMQGDLHAR